MKRIILKRLRIENFKAYKEAEFDFYGSTRVTGHNGVGKSSIAAAYMWLFLNIDYDLANNPDIRRKIEGNPVNDVLVSVEATLEIDGVTVTAKKVQKRTFKKDGSYTDDNSYFINDVPKTLRDFNAYFDFDMKLFKLCTNINAFLKQEPGEMREFLFGLVPDITNLDVARQFDELAELVPMLEKYSAEEVDAMNKASIRNIKKELDPIPSMIAENERYLVDNVDTAELELQRNALEEQLSEIQKQRDDAGEAYKVVGDLKMEIAKTRDAIGDVQRKANDRLNERRREMQQIHDELERKGNDLFYGRLGKESEHDRLLVLVDEMEKERSALGEKWKAAVAMEMDESETVCQMCGQELPADKVEQIRAEFEQRKTDMINKTVARGQEVKAEICSTKERIAQMDADIADLKQQWGDVIAEKNRAYEELNALPASADMSEDQEYTALQDRLATLQAQLAGMDTGEGIKQQFAAKEAAVRVQLDEVKEKLLSIAKNADYEERIADLEERRKTLEQKKADCEKIAYLLEQLDEKKNTLLVDKINEHFRIVKWDLFARGKNGAYLKNYCKPIIENRDYGSDTNTGREIEAKIDIAMAVQRATGIFCPIFLDGAESIDSWRIPKCESQLIVLCRTDDEELKIEEVA